MRSKTVAASATIMAALVLVSGCSTTPGTGGDGTTAARKVLLVSNQPVDPGTAAGEIVADGLDACTAAGWDARSIVVSDVNKFESTLSTAAREGYDIIATTFPPMSDATLAVADKFPDTKFVAIYQFSNTDGDTHANVASSSFSYEQTGYLWGVAAATLSGSGRIGVINGMPDPSSNTVINGAIAGAKATDPGAALTITYTNSYTDPAKGSENAAALINSGVDVIIAMADQSNIGVIDKASESGALVIGNAPTESPATVVATMPLTFGEPLANACAGDFAGGEHTVFPLSQKGAEQIIAEVTAWAKASGSDRGQAAIDAVTKAWADIQSGAVTVAVVADEPANG